MAYLFGDSFDFYTAIGDAAGYWDSSAATIWTLASGRFSGSLALTCIFTVVNNAVVLVKSSGSNDATHHIVCSYIQPSGFSLNTVGCSLQLNDGATAQCSIVFRFDGVIVLTSGTAAGSVLATYSNAFTPGVWQSFEFEVTIDNAAGAFHVRRDGVASDSFVMTGLNTRGGTANNYANKLTIAYFGQMAVSSTTFKLDDLLWFNTSGAAPNTWVGDVRAYQLMPVSDSSKQFAPISPMVGTSILSGSSSPTAAIANAVRYTPIIAPFTGTVGTATFTTSATATANVKVAVYDSSNGGQPGTALATANVIVNPISGLNTATFASPPSVVQGTTYFLATDQDASVSYVITSSLSNGYTGTTTYASFPASNPGSLASSTQILRPGTINITPTVNSQLVAETTQDGTTTYVYDATVGHADLYDVADLPTNISSIVALTTRAYMEKSDAGARTGRVQLISNGTTVTGDLVLSSSFSWCSRTDTVDPHTSSAWTLINANAVQIGPVVAA